MLQEHKSLAHGAQHDVNTRQIFIDALSAGHGAAKNVSVAEQLGPTSSIQIQETTVTPGEAVAFLKAFDPDGVHNLVAIGVTAADGRKTVAGRTFAPPHDWSAAGPMSRWIEAHRAAHNLYFTVNEPQPDAPNTKFGKGDIAKIRGVWVDIDPEKGTEEDISSRRQHMERERARLRELAEAAKTKTLPPTFALDSGSGVQLHWRLKDKLDVSLAGQAIEQTLGLIAAFGGDQSVHDIPRILRLPGTLNIPDAAKQASGRVQRESSLIYKTDRLHQLGELAVHYPPGRSPRSKVDTEDGSDVESAIDEVDLSIVQDAAQYEDLPSSLRSKFEDACSQSTYLSRLWERGEHAGSDKSASACRMALAAHLKPRGGFDVNEFGQLLWVWEHSLKSGDDAETKLNEREIGRCWARAEAIRSAAQPESFFKVLPDAEPAGETSKSRRFALTSFQDASSTALTGGALPLIKGLLHQGALSVLYGDSNVGKTFVAMDLAFSVATGQSWCFRKTAKLGVVYVAAEGGSGAMRRARALSIKYGAELSRSADFHFLPSAVNLRNDNEDLKALILAIKSAGNIGLVVIDTLSRALSGGEENSSVDMGALVKNVDLLRQHTKAHVMLVHHTGKNESKGARGHSLLRAATDTEMEVAAGELVVTKQRDMDGNFRQAFKLTSVKLGIDEDGEAITSCFVDYCLASELPPAELTAAETDILSALVSIEEGQENSASSGVKVADIAERLAASGKKTTSNAVRVGLQRLEKKRHVAKHGRGAWASKAHRNALCSSDFPWGPGGNETDAAEQTAHEMHNDIFN